MRRCYLVCYDIANARRLRKVHVILKGYGEPWQYSVFFCVLKNIDRVRLGRELKEAMHQDEDQIIILDMGPNEMDARETLTVLGEPLPKIKMGVIVV